MSKLEILRKIQAYKLKPELFKEVSNSELADLVLTVMGAVKAIDESIESKRLDVEGKYDKQAGAIVKDLELTTKQLLKEVTAEVNRMINTADNVLSETSSELEKRVAEAIANIRNGDNGIVTEEEIERAATMASLLIELPDLDALVTEALTANATATRDGLESLVSEEDKLKIEAIGHLRDELDELRRLIGSSVVGGFGGVSENRVRQLIAELGGGGGAVDSVNGQTGEVVLDADDIDDTSTTHKFVTASDITKLGHISVTQAVDLDQMETDIAALANGMVYKGDWDASAGTFPGAGVAQTGWFYYVTVAGTVGGVEFAIGDNIVATVDNASTTVYASNWSKHDQTDAVQSVVGLTGAVSKAGLLSAINVEDGADVTDTTNVTAAGALMDSEVTNLAQVKAFDATDYATAAQGSTADAALPKAGGTMTGNIALNGNYLSGDGGNEGVYVAASGNVGIGTTAPGTILETIVGSSALSIRNSTAVSSRTLYLKHDGTNAILDTSAYGAGTGGDIVFQHNSITELVRITSTGKVGIGTSSPSSKLHVAGNTHTLTASFPINDIGNSSTSFNINWTLSAYQKVTMTGNASVGTQTAPTIPASSGARIQLDIVQDATGGRDFTPPSNWVFPEGEPTWTAGTANQRIIITAMYNGTNYVCTGTSWFTNP